MKVLWAILLLLALSPSCIEYRLPRNGEPDRYIGWARTKPCLDPKVGPKVKVYVTDRGSIRPYLGGEIIHQNELLLGIGMIYYVDDQKSLEIGIRDSVYKNDDLLNRYRDNDFHNDPWDDANPMIFIGGVWRF